MIEPSNKDIGRAVNYVGNRYEGGEIERGIITAVSEHYVFVRYGADSHSKSTLRDDLEWADLQ